MSALKDFFTYSKAERRGIFILLTIIMGIVLYRQLIPGFIATPMDNCEDYRAEIEAFLAGRTEMGTQKSTSSSSGPFNYISTHSAQKTIAGKQQIIEVNGADTSALISLPGIGSSFAGRIVKYRELLGGYHHKEQLLEVYGMDSSRYLLFQQFITVDTAKVHKIHINQVEFKALLRHPYFNYEMVKSIFNYKNKVKKIKSLSELERHKIIPSPDYIKVKPYLVVN